MKVKAKMINKEDFSKFGSLLDPYNIKTTRLGDEKGSHFYPDALQFSFPSDSISSLCIITLQKKTMIFNNAEYHEFTEELLGGFNDDVIFFVGPPSKEPDLSRFEIFILPR